ncbi:hypothetical protein E2542_SST15801 [Spatholobus suberectus]|nr:hypothetical protein E2542_SST15801 [Spatholobus suberectus]
MGVLYCEHFRLASMDVAKRFLGNFNCHSLLPYVSLSELIFTTYGQLSRRGILAERKVSLKEGEHEEFKAELERQKWHILADLLDCINEAIIKEFYANAIPEEVGQVGRKAFVKGKHISYSVRTLNQLLKTERSPNASLCEFNKWVNSEQPVDDEAVASLLCISIDTPLQVGEGRSSSGPVSTSGGISRPSFAYFIRSPKTCSLPYRGGVSC